MSPSFVCSPPTFCVVYLALGTNLGDRVANLHAALNALPPAVQVLAQSSVYQTPPWDYTEQPAFLNMALQAQTSLSPQALLAYLKALEKRLGRRPSVRYGPRLIDLDILFYDEVVLQTPELTLPHPRLHERAFVLVPLAEIAPTLRHPQLGLTVAEMLATVNRQGIELFECEGISAPESTSPDG